MHEYHNNITALGYLGRDRIVVLMTRSDNNGKRSVTNVLKENKALVLASHHSNKIKKTNPLDRIVIDLIGLLPLTKERNKYIMVMLANFTTWVRNCKSYYISKCRRANNRIHLSLWKSKTNTYRQRK